MRCQVEQRTVLDIYVQSLKHKGRRLTNFVLGHVPSAEYWIRPFLGFVVFLSLLRDQCQCSTQRTIIKMRKSES